METPVCENVASQNVASQDVYSSFFPDYPDVVDMKQVGEMLGVCVKTVYRMVQNNELKSVRIGRQHRIAKLHIMQYIDIALYEN